VASIKPVAVTTRADAVETVERSIKLGEQIRRDLASTYAFALGGSTEEQELGECLTKMRQALKRLREAFGELAQRELPLE